MHTICIIIIIMLLGMLLLSYAYSRMVHDENRILLDMMDQTVDNLKKSKDA